MRFFHLSADSEKHKKLYILQKKK